MSDFRWRTWAGRPVVLCAHAFIVFGDGDVLGSAGAILITVDVRGREVEDQVVPQPFM